MKLLNAKTNNEPKVKKTINKKWHKYHKSVFDKYQINKINMANLFVFNNNF